MEIIDTYEIVKSRYSDVWLKLAHKNGIVPKTTKTISVRLVKLMDTRSVGDGLEDYVSTAIITMYNGRGQEVYYAKISCD